MNHKFIFDTNSLISAALLRTSINAKALNHALDIGRIAISEPVLVEFSGVIFRKKFDKYFLNDAERLEAISSVESNALIFFPKVTVNACRDLNDNMILELAITAGASCIISGDQDLLILNPFNDIPILTAADFLKTF
jgi:putative PIN family toxin of toxin-antitoxin system